MTCRSKLLIFFKKKSKIICFLCSRSTLPPPVCTGVKGLRDKRVTGLKGYGGGSFAGPPPIKSIGLAPPGGIFEDWRAASPGSIMRYPPPLSNQRQNAKNPAGNPPPRPPRRQRAGPPSPRVHSPATSSQAADSPTPPNLQKSSKILVSCFVF